MKFGIHLSTFTQEWDEDVAPYVSVAAEMGYDGVEFPLVDPHTFNRGAARAALRATSLACTCGTGLSAAADITSEDATLRGAGEAHLRRCVEICHELESEVLCGVLYAPWGVTGRRRTEGALWSIDVLGRVADYAATHGVTLAVELLNRYEGSLLNTVEDGLHFVRRIGAANVGLHLDTFHLSIEEKDLGWAVIQAGERMVHLHVCENDRGVPGSGAVRWRALERALRTIGYDGWVTLESFVTANCEVGDAVAIWRNIESSRRYVAEEGISFMHALFEEVPS